MALAGLSNHPTSEISYKIEDFHEGRMTGEALIEFLDTYKYASGVDPDEPAKGSSEWYLYHQDGGRPYKAGTWDEVRLNQSLGLLPWNLYQEVSKKAWARSKKM